MLKESYQVSCLSVQADPEKTLTVAETKPFAVSGSDYCQLLTQSEDLSGVGRHGFGGGRPGWRAGGRVWSSCEERYGRRPEKVNVIKQQEVSGRHRRILLESGGLPGERCGLVQYL